VTGPAIRAQIVRQSTWSIQDPRYALRQPIADSVIANADEWLTRDNPDVPIARFGDRVRVTVVEEFDPETGAIRSRLAQLSLGTIVIDSSFAEFLAPSTITSLVRRDHFWRDESSVEFSGGGEPLRVSSARDLIEEVASPMAQEPRIRIGLDEVSLRIGERVRVFEALGYELLALPGMSYGRVRAGVVYDRLGMWAELPLPIGSSSTPAIGRTLEAAFGAGLSFEAEHFSGAISWSGASDGIGAPALDGDTTFLLSRSATFTWTIPLRDIVGDDHLTLRVGGGYEQFVPLVRAADGRREAAPIDIPKLLVRGEYTSLVEGAAKRSAALEIFGTSALVSWHEQFTPLLGLRVVAVAHGLIADRPSYLPAYSVLITPTISIW
jgi:hypothetical protein